MNSYITLNGKKYKTSANNWFPISSVPSTARMLLDGTVDVAYGPGTILEWQGTIEISAQPASGYGSITDFNTAARLRSTMPFIDHYNSPSVNVHLLAPGGFRQRALIPMWDSAANKFFVEVRLIKA